MMETIQQSLRKLTHRDPIYCQICTVDKVDDLSCDVTNVVSTLPIPQVRLKAYLQGDNGIVIKPKVGSFVLVAFLSPTDAYVSMCDEIDSIDITIENTTLHMDKDYITMNGGSLKGLTKLEKLVDKLNNLEDAYNNLLTEYQSHVHGGVTTGNGSSAIMVPPSTQQPIDPKTNIDDLENKKITHG
jgi:hypothetical protein